MDFKTFVVALIIAAAFLAVVIVSIRNRKKGKCSCTGCSGCKGGSCGAECGIK